MATIDQLDCYGATFFIEPPIEVGDKTVHTLGEIAAIAIHGADSDPDTLKVETEHTDHAMLTLFDAWSVGPVARLLQHTMSSHGTDYTVRVQKY